jgi:hypothetical protein
MVFLRGEKVKLESEVFSITEQVFFYAKEVGTNRFDVMQTAATTGNISYIETLPFLFPYGFGRFQIFRGID